MDEALNRDSAFFGKRGSGKTTAAKTVVEGWLEESRRVCVLDPTGVWWGLRLTKDGKKKSGLNVIIFGGPHCDVPITPQSGEQVAHLIVNGTVPQCVIDTSDFSNNELVKFSTAFFETLFRFNKGPMHLVLDEADTFCPQQPRPDQFRMYGAVDKIARQGRVKGFRLTLITQRPAKIDKSVVAQISTLVAMKLVLPHDQKAVADWLRTSTDPETTKAILAKLPGLAVGQGVIWSSDDGTVLTHKFPMIGTFDSSRAPEINDAVIQPMPLEKIDLNAIRAQVDIQEDAPAKGAISHRAIGEEIKAAEHRGFLRGKEHGYMEGKSEGIELSRVDFINTLKETIAKLESYKPNQSSKPEKPYVQAWEVPLSKKEKPPKEEKPRVTGSLTASGQKMFNELVNYAPARWTWSQLCMLAGIKPSGGSFNTGRKTLRESGYISENGEYVEVSDEYYQMFGISRLNMGPEEMFELWTSKLPTPCPELLRALPPDGRLIPLTKLADQVNRKPTGGSWNTAISILRSNGLVETGSGNIQLSDMLARKKAA